MMKYYDEQLYDVYSSPGIEICALSNEGVVCISYGEPGTPGGELGPDDDDTILEF
ncbi:MAG: hypothetical protein MJY83_03700 [Bacteroidales bacterium]|nr:hypothetical protein [Bacteroidales bacterium]